MAKELVLHLRLDAELRELIEQAAAADDRQVADWCRRALRRAAETAARRT